MIPRACCTIDCGIVVSPDGAVNQTEGCFVDGIGIALYGGLNFKEGVPEHDNLDTYRMIRDSDKPKSIDVHFVKNNTDPTRVVEPPYPPIVGALANALYRATGKRHYEQPIISDD